VPTGAGERIRGEVRRRAAARRSRHTLVVMATAGLYEASGDWLYDVGLPGNSGIGGRGTA
jgi:glutaminase